MVIALFGKPKLMAAIGITAVVIITLTALLLYPASGEKIPSFSPNDRWTWEVTRQEVDPVTDNVFSTNSFTRIMTYLGEESRSGSTVSVFKLTEENRPGQYGLIFRILSGDEVSELASESYSNNQKVSEYNYESPLVLRRFPLKIGTSYSDSSKITGFDNTAGMMNIDVFETRTIRVVDRETLTEPGMLNTYVIEVRGSSRETMQREGAKAMVIQTYVDKIWCSKEIKNIIKSESQTTTILVTPQITSTTKNREEKILVSYSLK